MYLDIIYKYVIQISLVLKCNYIVLFLDYFSGAYSFLASVTGLDVTVLLATIINLTLFNIERTIKPLFH